MRPCLCLVGALVALGADARAYTVREALKSSAAQLAPFVPPADPAPAPGRCPARPAVALEPPLDLELAALRLARFTYDASVRYTLRFAGPCGRLVEDDELALAYSGQLDLLELGLVDEYVERLLTKPPLPQLRAPAPLPEPPQEGGSALRLDPRFVPIGSRGTLTLEGYAGDGAFWWRRSTARAGLGTLFIGPPRVGFGFLMQAGYRTPRIPLEATFRYGQLFPVVTPTFVAIGELGATLSYRFWRAATVVFDYMHGWVGPDVKPGHTTVGALVNVPL